MSNGWHLPAAFIPKTNLRKRSCAYLVLMAAVLLTFSVVAGAQEKVNLSRSVDAQSMLRWASRISSRSIPVSVKQPALISMSKESLAAMLCPENPEACSTVVAAYSIETGNIMYRATLDLDDLVHRSFIVHEMVHFLQHLEQEAQITATCQQILRNEREAYGVQATYLRRHGNVYATMGFPRRMSCE